ncbi:MAG: hypothetical protein D6717_05835 [Gammaproteobacteria bacterium]|nr:MAG: hypothetical protein D6717_05835 [Gammaproteobacteria bacterium]
MQRRSFIKLCTAFAAGIAARPQLLAAAEGPVQERQRVRLVDVAGRPLIPDNLEVGRNYLFHYPYRGTPCFLIRLPFDTVKAGIELKTEDGTSYRWRGGVGEGGQVVAFSAICSHLMTHPTKKIAFIHHYHGKASGLAGRTDVIACCAHGSVFDPAAGGKVIAGPAPQPLTAILLEQDEAGVIHAVGTQGADFYHQFLRTFKRELRKEFGRGVADDPVEGDARVRALDRYSRKIIDC